MQGNQNSQLHKRSILRRHFHSTTSRSIQASGAERIMGTCEPTITVAPAALCSASLRLWKLHFEPRRPTGGNRRVSDEHWDTFSRANSIKMTLQLHLCLTCRSAPCGGCCSPGRRSRPIINPRWAQLKKNKSWWLVRRWRWLPTEKNKMDVKQRSTRHVGSAILKPQQKRQEWLFRSFPTLDFFPLQNDDSLYSL